MISRRSFLLGLGGLVTSSFARQVQAHVLETCKPMLLEPSKADETLYVYEFPDVSDQEPWNKWRITLGPFRLYAPPAPTWREYLAFRGYRVDTPEDLERVCRERSLSPEELDQRIDGSGWGSEWQHFHSPAARAYLLLKDLGLDCALHAPGRKAGKIEFVDGGTHPGSCERWVELRDDLSVSLLQSRLVEQDLPISVKIGELY